MKQSMGRIDVVVPCYNYGRFLRSCVESVLSQQDVDVRVLIIDDASPDDTALVAHGLVAQDQRVQFRRHVSNRGNIATYNEGIEWAVGDYFQLLSADDYLLPGSLVRAASVFAAHPEVVLTCGRAAVAHEDKPFPQIPFQGERSKYKIMTGQDFIEATCANSSQNPIWTPTAVVRTSAQKAVGGYSKNLPHAGDLEMWLRLARLGSVAALDSYQAVYRRHGSNMHNSYTGVANLRQHLLAFESALASDSSKINTRTAMQERYNRGLAMGAIRAANHALNEDDRLRFQEAVSFAIEVYPRIRHTITWRGMHFRRLLGYRVVNSLRKTLKPVLAIIRS
jgi:glycosyltransferase involved in cell wall biosynthesis